MKIIADIENSLAGSIGRHVHWLQALVVTERTGNPGKRRAVAADKASKRAVRTVSCRCQITEFTTARYTHSNATTQLKLPSCNLFRFGPKTDARHTNAMTARFV